MKNFDKFGDKLIYGYSTKDGGVSKGCYKSMNLSFSLGDEIENVKENYKIWCESLGADCHKAVKVNQTHTSNVIGIDESQCGCGIFREPAADDTDAMVTNCKGVALITTHADCVPVFFYDPKKEAIGMAHAGWRGTVAEIARKTIGKMTELYSTDPKDVYAMVGPCISKKYFECDRDVIDAIDAMSIDGTLMYDYSEETGKYHVSLAGVNRLVLLDTGVPENQIDMCDECTYENDNKYFSHRRQGIKRGSQAALIQLK